jgi:hypothetical protein
MLRVGNTLGNGTLQPLACLFGIQFVPNTACEVSAEHQLRLAVAKHGRRAEPVLGGSSVHR